MKKFLSLISSLLIFSCSNVGVSELPITEQSPVNNVQTNSIKSIYTFYKKFKEYNPKIFASMDFNNDKFVSKDEFIKFNLGLFKFSIPIMGNTSFEDLDKNKDGKLTVKEIDLSLFSEIKFVEEVRKFSKETFVDYDKNSDGFLNKEELLDKKLYWLQKIIPDTTNKTLNLVKIKFSPEFFSQYDDNNDLKLSLSELEILSANEALEFLMALNLYQFKVGKS
ncbi:MAG: hypothetical protein AABZ74_13585 [Cyanobacteriota bacterium]